MTRLPNKFTFGPISGLFTSFCCEFVSSFSGNFWEHFLLYLLSVWTCHNADSHCYCCEFIFWEFHGIFLSYSICCRFELVIMLDSHGYWYESWVIFWEFHGTCFISTVVCSDSQGYCCEFWVHFWGTKQMKSWLLCFVPLFFLF